LVLDDEFDVMSVIKQGIEKHGFRVFAFTDASLALEHFRINSSWYGLVVTDLRMPGMNGYEFIKKVKEMEPDVKVFFMTAFEIDDIEFNRVLPSIKIDEFIDKPVSIKNLVDAIAKYVDRKHKRRNLER
jgi:two-component system C4-dicarboxylate transport response regulator DctD